MNMSEKIKYHRQELGLTLEELGNKVGVSKSTVRKWETGMIANMRRDKIAKLAKALGVSPSYLMGWTDEEAEKREIFQRNFRRLVDESGKTQLEIAKNLGFSYTTVNAWYRGDALPDTGNIQQIANYFHVSISDLLDEKNEESSAITLTDPKDRFTIMFRNGGKDMTEEEKDKLLDFIASNIDQFYKLRGIEE